MSRERGENSSQELWFDQIFSIAIEFLLSDAVQMLHKTTYWLIKSNIDLRSTQNLSNVTQS